jgi:hypothetical protein
MQMVERRQQFEELLRKFIPVDNKKASADVRNEKQKRPSTTQSKTQILVFDFAPKDYIRIPEMNFVPQG